jgi:hypothetical protein
MEFIPFIVLVVLFILLTPGVLLRIPPSGGKLTVVFVHAILFATIYILLPDEIYFEGADSDSFKQGNRVSQVKIKSSGGKERS